MKKGKTLSPLLFRQRAGVQRQSRASDLSSAGTDPARHWCMSSVTDAPDCSIVRWIVAQRKSPITSGINAETSALMAE